MGSPVHPVAPPPAGEDCLTCTPSLFKPGHTPKLMHVVIHGVTPTPGWPAPPNGYPVWLEQDGDNPCNWFSVISYLGTDFRVDFNVSAARLIYQIWPGYMLYVFWGEGPPCEFGPLPNLGPPWAPGGSGGTGNILVGPPEYVLRLAVEMNFQPGLRALYDDIPAADPARRCIRLTGRISPGSCLFLFEP